MENVYYVNNEVIEATSMDSTDWHASMGDSQPGCNEDVTATCPDIYDFLEAYHESCLAISQEFRDFRTKHIVDAMDCHGNWIAATVESLHYTHPQGMHSLTHSFTYLLTHSLTNLLTHSLTYSLTHSLTYSLTHLLTHSLTHTLLLQVSD